MYFPIIVILSLTVSLTSSSQSDKATIEREYVDDYPSHLVHSAADRPPHVEQLLRKSSFVPLGNTRKFNDVTQGQNFLSQVLRKSFPRKFAAVQDGSMVPVPPGVEIQHRKLGIGDGEVERGDNQMCLSRMVTISGYLAEECVKPGQNCEIVFPGYRMKCVQKYVYVTLKRNREVKIPGGCVCVKKRL